MSEEFVLMDDDLYYECDKYAEYTERATAVPSGQKIDSEIPCDQITAEGDYCSGTVQLNASMCPGRFSGNVRNAGPTDLL